MFRVCTYPDPFKINENPQLWELITNHPQFCASQTLVQGMNRYYKKSSFYFIQTAKTLIDNVYEGWEKNFKNDMKIYLSVSKHIQSIDNENLAKSLKYNISEVVQTVKLLLMMQADRELFNDDNLSYEQKAVLEIYEKISAEEVGLTSKKYTSFNKKDLRVAFNRCLLQDINQYLERENAQEYRELKNLNEAARDLTQLSVKYQRELDGGNPFEVFGGQIDYREKIKEVKAYLSLIKNSISFDTVVFHGIHKISPLMYFLFKLLDINGIQVVFVINYMENYPTICSTWNRVYSWTKCEFEYVQSLNNPYNEIGLKFGQLFENDFSPTILKNQIYKFQNMTHFTDEVSTVYAAARKEAKNNNSVLSKMKVQYYATETQAGNDILKIYYPEQFADKHFLSYPIGQFILNIYNMWDVKKNALIISFPALCECINAGILMNLEISHLLDICKKMENFFEEETDFQSFSERAQILKENICVISENSDYALLKKISFYSLSQNDVDTLLSFVVQLNKIAEMIFNQGTVHYKKHFQKLMETVISLANSNGASESEQKLIHEIYKRLDNNTDDEIEGSVEDLREAMFYYLSASESKDSSNWIIRGFDQIDGGVLLSKKSRAKAYHFAMLSDRNLCGKKLQELPFPLTVDMFKDYEESDSCVNVLYQVYLEQRNYLRFCLFYGLIFTQKEIELSYVEKETEDDTQKAYYGIKALGIEEVEREYASFHKLKTDRENKNDGMNFDFKKLTYTDQEFFAVCPYKYFLSTVINTPVLYQSNYHIQYFVSIFMNYYLQHRFNGEEYLKIQSEFDSELKKLRKLFIFLSDGEFSDAAQKVKKDLDAKAEKQADLKMNELTPKYLNRKVNFLIAQWEERFMGTENGVKQMRYPENFQDGELQSEMENYMETNSVYNFETRRKYPHMKVCENCNFSELCLRNYSEELQDEYIDFGNSPKSE